MIFETVKKMVAEGKNAGCAECINCGACADACPKDVLGYKLLWKNNKKEIIGG